jgi:hypothetical protein
MKYLALLELGDCTTNGLLHTGPDWATTTDLRGRRLEDGSEVPYVARIVFGRVRFGNVCFALLEGIPSCRLVVLPPPPPPPGIDLDHSALWAWTLACFDFLFCPIVAFEKSKNVLASDL